MNHLRIGCREEYLLSRPNRSNHPLATAGVKLGEHVVEQENWRFSGLSDEIFGLGKFEGEARRSLLAPGSERSKVTIVD